MDLNLYPSPAWRHLSRKKRLRGYLENLGLDPQLSIKDKLSSERRQYLIQTGLAIEASSKPAVKLPFNFVSAWNIELTYGCNLACTHCLQDALRPREHGSNWLEFDAIKLLLKDAKNLGLAKTGINFTGGEIFSAGSPVLKLIRYASELGLDVRSNTNAWWGRNRNIRIGDEIFDSHEDLVRALKEAGLNMLALSLDDRYERYPGLFDKMVAVAIACEKAELLYQPIMTSPPPEMKTIFYRRLNEGLGHDPYFLQEVKMEMVDVGGSIKRSDSLMDPAQLASLPKKSPCKTKGFYQPHTLHVTPGGGLRSCMYAPGSGNFGNIKTERLIDILNRAGENQVLMLFENQNIDEFTEKYIAPWSSFYRKIEHPCTASALISRVAEKIDFERKKLGREPLPDEMKEIHRSTALEYRTASEKVLNTLQT